MLSTGHSGPSSHETQAARANDRRSHKKRRVDPADGFDELGRPIRMDEYGNLVDEDGVPVDVSAERLRQRAQALEGPDRPARRRRDPPLRVFPGRGAVRGRAPAQQLRQGPGLRAPGEGLPVERRRLAHVAHRPRPRDAAPPGRGRAAAAVSHPRGGRLLERGGGAHKEVERRAVEGFVAPPERRRRDGRGVGRDLARRARPASPPAAPAPSPSTRAPRSGGPARRSAPPRRPSSCA